MFFSLVTSFRKVLFLVWVLLSLNKMLGLSFVPDWLMRLSQVTGAVYAFYPGLSGPFVWEHQDRQAALDQLY